MCMQPVSFSETSFALFVTISSITIAFMSSLVLCLTSRLSPSAGCVCSQSSAFASSFAKNFYTLRQYSGQFS